MEDLPKRLEVDLDGQIRIGDAVIFLETSVVLFPSRNQKKLQNGMLQPHVTTTSSYYVYIYNISIHLVVKRFLKHQPVCPTTFAVVIETLCSLWTYYGRRVASVSHLLKLSFDGGEMRNIHVVGGGNFKYFWNFHPENWGRHSPNLTVRIFFRWVGEKPPTRFMLGNS